MAFSDIPTVIYYNPSGEIYGYIHVHNTYVASMGTRDISVLSYRHGIPSASGDSDTTVFYIEFAEEMDSRLH